MHRLIEQIRTPEFEAAHPALQASYCHYAFVVIHPFADGNGRVARALASTFFYQGAVDPVGDLRESAAGLSRCVGSGGRGELGAGDLVLSGTEESTRCSLWQRALMTAEAPRPEELAKRIGSSARTWTGLYDSEIDLIGLRILGEIQKKFRDQVNALGMPSFSIVKDDIIETTAWKVPGHRLAPSSAGTISLENRTLQASRSGATSLVFFSKDSSQFPFVIHNHQFNDPLEIRLEDVYPELTPHFLLRLDQWVRRQLGSILARIAESNHSNNA